MAHPRSEYFRHRGAALVEELSEAPLPIGAFHLAFYISSLLKKEHPAWFHRFEAVWTPTVLLLASDGKERVRLEGYLPNDDFVAALESGLGRIAFVHKKYPDAERWYGDVVTRLGRSHSAPARCTGGP